MIILSNLELFNSARKSKLNMLVMPYGIRAGTELNPIFRTYFVVICVPNAAHDFILLNRIPYYSHRNRDFFFNCLQN